MKDGPVTQHYGFGSARLRLAPEPYRPERDTSFADALASALRERGHGRSLLRQAIGFAPAAVLLMALLLAFVATFVQERRDDPDVDLVMLASQDPFELTPPPPLPEVVPPEPEIAPPPEPVAPKPPPPVAKPPRPEPPPMVRPKPPPPPVAKPPRPQPPQRIAKPKPRPPKARPRPTQPPTLAPPEPAPAERPPPTRLAAKRAERPPAPRPAPPVAMPTVARAEATPPTRAPQRSRARPTQAPRATAPPPPGLSAVPQTQQGFDVARATTRSSRPSRALPASSRSRSPAPVMAAAAPVTAPSEPSRSAPSRAGRAAPSAAPRQAPRPRMDLPGAAPSAPQRTAAAPERGARTAAPAAPDRTNRSDAPRMRGVPLASLASCVRDSDEDQLKRRVISRVSSPGECVSPAGRYRFVETKNLNAFLMWVERASHRREGDRCTELALALECLDERRVRGS